MTVYRLWIHKQHMCRPLAIVLKMAVWPIISISVFKHEPDDAMFYLKLGMYHPGGGILYLSNTFLVCTGPYVACLRVFRVIAYCLKVAHLKIIIYLLLEGRNEPINLTAH